MRSSTARSRVMASDSPAPGRLPFGAGRALEFDCVAACGAFLQGIPHRPSRFDSLGPADRFRLNLSALSFPAVHLLAGSGTAKAVTHESPRATLVIPFGRCESRIQAGPARYRWASPHHAFFIPAGQRVEAESTAGAFLRLDLEASALAAIAPGIATLAPGPGPGPDPVIDLESARPVPLQAGGTDWLHVFRSICQTVDAFGGDDRRLTATGLDDVVLRTAILMLAPDLHRERPGESRAARRVGLDPLLEQMMDRLAERITLSDLEAWSGRSARAIQLAFRSRFGVGPVQWLRDRRLDRIHERLAAGADAATIRELARACGIDRMATLIPEYRRRFGELPSQTRRGGRSDRGPDRVW